MKLHFVLCKLKWYLATALSVQPASPFWVSFSSVISPTPIIWNEGLFNIDSQMVKGLDWGSAMIYYEM